MREDEETGEPEDGSLSSRVLSTEVFYDRAAPYYDDVIMKPFKETFTNEAEERFLSSLFPRGSKLLDLGSGTGRSIGLLQGVYQVFGVDVSQGMLRKGNERGIRTCVLGDISHMPFGSGSFDGAYSMHGGLSHLPTTGDKSSALVEIDRILKAKCVLMIDVPNPHREDRGPTYVVEWQAGHRKISLRGYGWLQEELCEMLGELGFSDIVFLGGYSLGKPFELESSRMIALARRGQRPCPNRDEIP